MCPINVYGRSEMWSSVRSGTMTCRCNSSVENDYLCMSWKHMWVSQTWSTDEVGTGQKDVIRRHIMTIWNRASKIRSALCISHSQRLTLLSNGQWMVAKQSSFLTESGRARISRSHQSSFLTESERACISRQVNILSRESLCKDRYSQWEWKSAIVCDQSAFMSKQRSKSALTIHWSNNGRRAIIISHRICKSMHRQAGEYLFMRVTVQGQISAMTFKVRSYVCSCLTPLLSGIR